MMNEPNAPSFFHVLEDPVRLLVVDDDPIQREFATVYLSTPTAEVVTAPMAHRALAKLKSDHFDMVLIDYEMPGVNGVELIRLIRADPALRDIPIIMVTGHDDVATIDAAYLAGATSFATKPVNWRLLSYQIKYVLRAHALQHRRESDG